MSGFTFSQADKPSDQEKNLSASPPVLSIEVEAKASEGVAELLKYVAEGQQDEAEALLKINPRLALEKGEVKDSSWRKFEAITGFQYALWALDWHMWEMLLKYFPLEEAAKQWKALESTGTKHGKQVSWEKLIDAYKQVELYGEIGQWEACNREWMVSIVAGQSALPVHVVNEYCHPTRSFAPLPDFRDTMKLPRHRTIAQRDWYNLYGLWQGGAYKGATTSCRRYEVVYKSLGSLLQENFKASKDRIAITLLLKTRQEQRAKLGRHLSRVLRQQAINQAFSFLGSFPSALLAFISAYDASDDEVEKEQTVQMESCFSPTGSAALRSPSLLASQRPVMAASRSRASVASKASEGDTPSSDCRIL